MTEYDPLAYESLAEAIVNKVSNQDQIPLDEDDEDRLLGLEGAGVYVLGAYYPEDIYDVMTNPVVYVSRARPKGSNTGMVLGKSTQRSTALRSRIKFHRETIEQAENLDLNNFWVQALPIVPVYIDLAESALISVFKPVWNNTLKGFGSMNPGSGRRGQNVSEWDTVHPGREWTKYHRVTRNRVALLQRVDAWLRVNQPTPQA